MVLPEMLPGCAGVVPFTFTVSVLLLLPQVLLTVTEMLPPELPVTVETELLIEEPVQPIGKLHA